MARKTLGDDSGPVPEVATSSGKSMGGAPAVSRPEPKPAGSTKTIGGMDEPAPELDDPEPKAPEPKASEPKTSEGDGPRDLVAELERLALLLDKGILNQDEFDQAKKKLLS